MPCEQKPCAWYLPGKPKPFQIDSCVILLIAAYRPKMYRRYLKMQSGRGDLSHSFLISLIRDNNRPQIPPYRPMEVENRYFPLDE
jgi:hypothetical protein